MMKIGISGGYIDKYGLAEGLKKMRAHGYECIDYDMSDTTVGFYLYEGKEFEKKVTETRKAIEDAGIKVSQTHGPWRWPPQDFTDEDRAERFEKMCKSIIATKLLGCRNFVIHPIMPFGDNQDPYPDKLWEMNVEFFRRLLPVAVENDVIICYENMPMVALSNSKPDAILRFAKEMNSPYFKVCLDTGHCAVFGDQPADAVRLLGKEYLQVLHIHDNDGHGDRHWLPYTGVIDWEDFAKSLQEIGFEGCVSLETGVPGNLPDDEREKKEIELAKIALHLAGRA